MTEDLATRRRTMQAVRSKDTGPEQAVRHLVTNLGYRYRLHRKDLPGTPDLAFIGRRKAIFVHGCFWHGHGCARGARAPRNNASYWAQKIERNRTRDEKNERRLVDLGWQILAIWECQLKHPEAVRAVVADFLE